MLDSKKGSECVWGRGGISGGLVSERALGVSVIALHGSTALTFVARVRVGRLGHGIGFDSCIGRREEIFWGRGGSHGRMEGGRHFVIDSENSGSGQGILAA